jgi:hypothetical protein
MKEISEDFAAMQGLHGFSPSNPPSSPSLLPLFWTTGSMLSDVQNWSRPVTFECSVRFDLSHVHLYISSSQ